MTDEEIRSLTEKSKQIIDDETALAIETASEKLALKYGEDFKAFLIGDRLDRPTSKIAFEAENSPEVTFSAEINTDTGECTDDYVRRCIGKKLGDELAEKLKKDTASACAVKLISDDDREETAADMSVTEYFEKYHVTGMLIYMIAPSQGDDKDALSDKIKRACDELGEQYDMTVVLYCCFIVDRYEHSAEKMRKFPFINSGAFDFFDTDHSFSYAAHIERRE